MTRADRRTQLLERLAADRERSFVPALRATLDRLGAKPGHRSVEKLILTRGRACDHASGTVVVCEHRYRVQAIRTRPLGTWEVRVLSATGQVASFA